MDWDNPKTGIAFCGTIAAICNAAAFIHAISRKQEHLGPMHEGHLLALKNVWSPNIRRVRTISYATLAISEGLLLLLNIASDWSGGPLMDVQKLSAVVSWAIGVVCLKSICTRQGFVMLMIPAECTLLMSSLLLANFALSSAESHGEDFMGLIVHSLQLLVLITLMLAEVLISRHFDTLLKERLDFEDTLLYLMEGKMKRSNQEIGQLVRVALAITSPKAKQLRKLQREWKAPSVFDRWCWW